MTGPSDRDPERRRMVIAAVLTLLPIWLAGSVIPRDLGQPLWLIAVVVWSMVFAALAWWIAGRLVARRP